MPRELRLCSAWLALLARELRLALRHPADTLAAVLFFVLVAALFPFGVGPAPETLGAARPRRAGPPPCWPRCCRSTACSARMPRTARWTSCCCPACRPAAVALAKALAHWLTTGLPLLLAAPIAGGMLNLPVEACGAAWRRWGSATGFLSLLGTAGAALTLGARRGGVLLPLLVLPLATPALIFGAAAIEARRRG